MASYDDILMGDDNANYNTSGDYQLNGRNGNDIIFGEGGNDHIEGGKGDDILIGGEGYDTYIYVAGDGNDRLVDSGDNRILLIDADGTKHLFDKVFKTNANTWTTADGKTAQLTHNSPWKLVLDDGSTIELGENFQDGDFGIHLKDMPATPETTRTIVGDLTPIAGYDDLGNPVTDPGSPDPNKADLLFDSAGNDRIESGGGDDTIDAWRGGDDVILGGGGNDAISAHAGNDVLEGGTGTDQLMGGDGDDQIFADNSGAMADLIAAGDIAQGTSQKGDLLSGNGGDDLLYGSNDADALFGGEGDDLLTGGGGDDVIMGDGDCTASNSNWNATVTPGESVSFDNVTYVTPVAGGGTISRRAA